MASSCERLCKIQELVDAITAYLELGDLLSFARTCKTLYRNSFFKVYRNMENLYTVFRLFSSISALHALARNVQHVSALSFGVDELVYYYHCVRAFEEINSHTTITSGAQTCWLLPPNICRFVALPPITHLSRLTIDLLGSRNRTYTMASVKNPRATFAQLSWLLAQNPGLTSLDMDDVIISDIRGGRVLLGAITRLNKLESLKFRLSCAEHDWNQLCSLLFSACQPSIKRLVLCTWCGEQRDQVGHGGDKGEDEVMAMVPKRHGPLVNLEELSFSGIYANMRRWGYATDLMSIFEQCPNIKKLDALNLFSGPDTAAGFGASVGKDCPKIESLKFETFDRGDSFAFKILDFLPAQQLQHFDFKSAFKDFSNTTVTHAILRHSTSLREIRINGSCRLHNIPISVFLKECVNLEVLYIPLFLSDGLYTTLENILEHPWACFKLTHLSFAIGVHKLPVFEPVQPYYLRPTPITLSLAESRHLAQLELFYQQLGALAQLEELNLRMVSLRENGEVDEEMLDTGTAFPAMLNLEDPLTGRPGFLHHLAGLSKLERLRGAFWVDTEEAEVTVGWAEVRWMDEHWPRLRGATFFERAENITAPFKWLQERVEDRRIDCWTERWG
ncbi:hypothetical protein EC991_011408 [Linnemannia zychae]|nr:hypothetical protein EC991_011408 [Linnemannia zychae]